MILKKAYGKYYRQNVLEDSENMYIFTDNGDRTSGKGKIPDDSEYSKTFGKTKLHYPSVTSAIIRGLPNAYPITTQRYYRPGNKFAEGNWNDEDFDEFKKVIDEDFERIKKTCIEKGYKQIIFPSNGVLNGPISRITIERTPKLYSYIVEKEIELKKINL